MKVHNAVIGMEVQVKRDCRGHFNEFIKKGLVCTVDRIDDSYMADYELRLVNPNIEDGYAWVNASDVRRYKEEVPKVPQEDIKVGDSVLVGAEGAGNYLVCKRYAGLVCNVVDTSHHDDCVEISHPDVMGGTSYTSRKQYLTKDTPKPKALTLQDIQVGDWVVCSDDRYGLTMGVAYEVLRVHSDDGLYVSNPERPEWVTGFATRTSQFNKVLREVNDATPRVVKSGSESTCRSE